jgi:hypothetical protein
VFFSATVIAGKAALIYQHATERFRTPRRNDTAEGCSESALFANAHKTQTVAVPKQGQTRQGIIYRARTAVPTCAVKLVAIVPFLRTQIQFNMARGVVSQDGPAGREGIG